jgi:long-chain acyl-CoA synthetase
MNTLVDIFRKAAGSGRLDLARFKRHGEWVSISAGEFAENTRVIAAGLAEVGAAEGDRIALLCDNRPEWAMIDFATVCSGAVTVPIYTSYQAPQVEELLKDSGSLVAFAGSLEDLSKIQEGRARCPTLRFVVLIEGRVPASADVLGLAQLLEMGRHRLQREPELLEVRSARVRATNLATLIYTSGTTGQPKGAMLTHGNFVSDVLATQRYLPVESGDVALSFLPLAHVFERMIDYSYYSVACSVAYVDSFDKIGEAFLEVRPTVFASVPRVYEKVKDRVLSNVEKSSPLKRKLFAAAMSAGRSVVERREANRRVSGVLALRYRFFDRLVFSKIRARLGGRFRFSGSGGAPLGRDTAEFFWAAGIEIFEGYGLTETSPIISVNHAKAWRLGSVGPLLPGVEVSIAADGEILVRGPIVMQGYWKKPEASAEVFTPDGWFKTGDIGFLDKDGFLFITDRKKELLVNAYGKNIAPAPIEAALQSIRLIASAVLIGDRRRFVSALIVPDYDRLETWAAQQGLKFRSREQMVLDARVRKLFQGAIDILNADQPHEHQIRKFALLPKEFSLESGELTPTLKVKRRVVAQKYHDVIEAMYAGPSE